MTSSRRAGTEQRKTFPPNHWHEEWSFNYELFVSLPPSSLSFVRQSLLPVIVQWPQTEKEKEKNQRHWVDVRNGTRSTHGAHGTQTHSQLESERVWNFSSSTQHFFGGFDLFMDENASSLPNSSVDSEISVNFFWFHSSIFNLPTWHSLRQLSFSLYAKCTAWLSRKNEI